MGLQVMYISVLGLSLAVVRHVDQVVEALTVWIASHEGLELILVKLDQLTNRLGEGIQKLLGVLTVANSRH